MSPTARFALLVVDVQKDFCPGGALAVKGGDLIVPRLNRVIRLFSDRRLPILYSRDWHPANHISFTSRGGPWPPHCIKETPGAEFNEELLVQPGSIVVSKGTKPDEEAYSAFQGTGLAAELRRMDVKELFVGGLATDYCVKNTVLDALNEGFAVSIMADCVKGVNLRASDSARALRAMTKAGATHMSSEDVVEEIGRRVAVVSSS